jgi:hypothetical protein
MRRRRRRRAPEMIENVMTQTGRHRPGRAGVPDLWFPAFGLIFVVLGYVLGKYRDHLAAMVTGKR